MARPGAAARPARARAQGDAEHRRRSRSSKDVTVGTNGGRQHDRSRECQPLPRGDGEPRPLHGGLPGRRRHPSARRSADSVGSARGRRRAPTCASSRSSCAPTRERLQTTTEELETSNEELKSAQRGASSVNEELQSANEELETSKEELQSINEELQTVNAELNARVEELEPRQQRHRQPAREHADRDGLPRPQPARQELHAGGQGPLPPGRERRRPADHPCAGALPVRHACRRTPSACCARCRRIERQVESTTTTRATSCASCPTARSTT